MAAEQIDRFYRCNTAESWTRLGAAGLMKQYAVKPHNPVKIAAKLGYKSSM